MLPNHCCQRVQTAAKCCCRCPNSLTKHMEEHEGEAESWTSSCLLSRNNDNIQLKRENCSCKEKMCIQDWRKHTHTCVRARTHAHRCACKLVCRLLYITNLCSCGTVYEWLQSGVAFGQKILTIIVMSGQLQLGERYISSRRSPRHNFCKFQQLVQPFKELLPTCV